MATGKANLSKKWTKKAEYIELRQDLLDDLDARGLVGRHFTDKVEEYISLWCIFQMLREDVDTRGVAVEYSNGATQRGVTDNKSLPMMARISAQMLNIWTALGFKDLAANSKPQLGGDDDEL